MLQIKVEVAGLNCRTSTPRMNTATAPPMIMTRRILRGHVRLYFVLECGTGVVGQRDESVYPPDAGRAVRIGVVDDADDAALACPDGLVCRRGCAAMARQAKRPRCGSVRPHDKGRRAHAGGEHLLEGNCFSGRIGHCELFFDVAVLYRDRAEIIECFGRDER